MITDPMLIKFSTLLLISLSVCVISHIFVVFHFLSYAQKFILYLKEIYPEKWKEIGAPISSLSKFLKKEPYWPEVFHRTKTINDLNLKEMRKILVKKISLVQLFPTLIGTIITLVIVPACGYYLYKAVVGTFLGHMAI